LGRPGLGGRARRSRALARPRDRIGLAGTGVRHLRVARAATGDAERGLREFDRRGPLYERVGMRTARAWDAYEKRVV